MAKEQQLPLSLDLHDSFAALRLDISDVEKMMDNLERSFGRKPTPRKQVTHVTEWDFDGGEGALGKLLRESGEKRRLRLGAVISARDFTVAIDVREDVGGDLQYSLGGVTGNMMTHGVDYGTPIESKVGGAINVSIPLLRSVDRTIVLNIDKQFRTGSAYLSHKGQKLGLAELKEVP